MSNSCAGLPGFESLQWVSEAGEVRRVGEVLVYLLEIDEVDLVVVDQGRRERFQFAEVLLLKESSYKVT